MGKRWWWAIGAVAITAVAAVLVVALSSDGDDEETSGPDETPTVAASPTTSSSGPTGVADVDRVIAGLASGEPATIDSLLQFTKIKCVTTPQGLGAPPACPAGIAEGTAIESILAGNCEGVWIRKGEHDEVVSFLVRRSQSSPDVYAVSYAKPTNLAVDDGGLPPSQYTVIYGRAGEANTWYPAVDQGIVSVFDGCGQRPETIAERRDITKPNNGYLLPPGSP